jgi:hypothetical protein
MFATVDHIVTGIELATMSISVLQATDPGAHDSWRIVRAEASCLLKKCQGTVSGVASTRHPAFETLFCMALLFRIALRSYI